MIVVMGALHIRASDVERMKPPMRRQMTATRTEPDCEFYVLANDLLDPCVLQVAERWRDQAALGAHLVSDHMVQFNIDMRAARLSRASVNSYHPDGTVKKIIDLNATDTQFTRENKAMVIVMGTAQFAPGEIDRLHGAMAAQIAATRAEDGCEHYAYARDMFDPDLMHISERWRDNAAIAAHFAAPHMAAFNAALASAKLLSLSVKAYEGDNVRTLMGE